jgi:hypothetical protein
VRCTCKTTSGEEISNQRYSEAKAAVKRAAADHPNRPYARVEAHMLKRYVHHSHTGKRVCIPISMYPYSLAAR